MQKIIECVPNFSNGRNPEIYNAIAQSIQSVRGIRILSVSADPDHNRTVITFVGEPANVEEAAFKAIAKAAQLINMDEHSGEHPRLGATDVCPFIPVKDVSMSDCIALARRLGERVGTQLGIPVYLYADAALRPEREKLADIRKGEYELWKKEVATNPARKPDFGPAEAKPTGATVIGARPFLIAYNLYLNSGDVAIADKIAKEIRFIGGGFRYLQAKGFLVDGQAQVSMNLTHFEKTPIYRVQELVRREAAHYGLSITKAELVGVTPQKALIDSAKWYLQLDSLSNDQILEYQLLQEEETPITPTPFIEAVAASVPTPGGGSVAALAGALAAALAQMVAGLTVGRKKYAAVDETAKQVLAESDSLREKLTQAIAEDAASFERVMATAKNKEIDEETRQQEMEKATIGAGEVPLQVARWSRDVAQLAATIAEVGNLNAVTDAAAGVLLARAAVQIAALNVKINGVNLQNQALVQAWKAELTTIEAEVTALVDKVTAVAAERGGF